ncbi:hypothetical protein [Portibacter marinus]|uniref:hypothetical protein n=1 Tax=Portibacter marinus TaxID=2898660 RepID=UPI001F36A7BD|nr:hypothetical protein [Portibacter marinus]
MKASIYLIVTLFFVLACAFDKKTSDSYDVSVLNLKQMYYVQEANQLYQKIQQDTSIQSPYLDESIDLLFATLSNGNDIITLHKEEEEDEEHCYCCAGRPNLSECKGQTPCCTVFMLNNDDDVFSVYPLQEFTIITTDGENIGYINKESEKQLEEGGYIYPFILEGDYPTDEYFIEFKEERNAINYRIRIEVSN